jgi:hypothetical protein
VHSLCTALFVFHFGKLFFAFLFMVVWQKPNTTMVGFLKKSIDGSALDVDKKSRRVKIAIASTENVDLQNDVIAKGAFNRTIAHRGPQGTNEIWHLIDHNASIQTALGKFSELGMEGQHLVGVSEYKDSYLWREVVWPLYEKGDINQHSIG